MKESKTKSYYEAYKKRKEELKPLLEDESLDWRPLCINENYLISNTGLIINTQSCRILTPYKTKVGYVSITIKGYTYRLHRLLALTYLPKPELKNEVNHKNGIKDDNRLENLEWVTRQENVIHSFVVLGKKSNFHKNGNKHSEETKEKMKVSQRKRFDRLKFNKTAIFISPNIFIYRGKQKHPSNT